jgi:hypothetical protein
MIQLFLFFTISNSSANNFVLKHNGKDAEIMIIFTEFIWMISMTESGMR